MVINGANILRSLSEKRQSALVRILFHSLEMEHSIEYRKAIMNQLNNQNVTKYYIIHKKIMLMSGRVRIFSWD